MGLGWLEARQSSLGAAAARCGAEARGAKWSRSVKRRNGSSLHRPALAVIRARKRVAHKGMVTWSKAGGADRKMVSGAIGHGRNGA
jgi:hypothetical protein